ncbi:MAG: NAD(P)/FAD-dependent oxidoreductase [Flavobacteriales bacterium]|nr:MAG: NAD(P)/FAD-dependent oxidoreductase [Bacteroidota bacterium]KXK35650.1 MAG: D-amino acid dehydrogenase small subunit [Chlorobi bacterium OLB6]MBE2264794.1 NAD(P)/FAD-dependent oxidoreductase [Flavobacteriales bacterium]MBV6463805.1 hypothetical protein [Chlorobiota bacterium]MBW7853676.1 NAD(P)/FAD-dependent oxidoreductase [Candidatus Kapabacteria bacterium]MCC6332090.1 NAD(P)/FAD-dependent oxidoreductase [Ignavibacteria bacterium]
MKHVVVLGAGAAGLMCAARAARQGVHVTVVEHMSSPGKKIRISGGGRCNFTNLETAPDRYVSANPHFARSALSRYTPTDFLMMVNQYGISWHEKTRGQLFCDGSAQQIIAMLMSECNLGGVRFEFNATIHTVEKADRFRVETSSGILEADAVVVATGGLSIPRMGATGIGHRIAQHFSMPVTETAPALVPLVSTPEFRRVYGTLSGVSLPVRVTAGNTAFSESMLFTHNGLSGPAILQISTYLGQADSIVVNLLPDGIPESVSAAGAAEKRLLRTILGEILPKRLLQQWPDERLGHTRASMATKTFREALDSLQEWTVEICGTEGYAKAEVTRGGVDTRALSSKTMESTTVGGLYFIGEVVDVTGWLGGYNFQWAWASAVAAADAIASVSSRSSS